MKDLIFRLSQGTGLHFYVHEETREPVGVGDKLTYWMTSESKGGYHLAALNMFGEGDSYALGSESELIDKLNELENENRIVSR